MNRGTFSGVCRLAAVLAVGLQACGSNSATELQEQARPVTVSVAAVRRGDIATHIQATGTIMPSQESFIGPRVSGRIEKLFADEGDFVEKGAPLVRLEQVRFKLALDEAEAALQESTAQCANLKLKYRRQKELYEQGVIDKQIFDDLATEVELAGSRLDMAKARLDRAREDYKDSVLPAPFAGFVVEKKMNEGELFSEMPNEYVFHLVDTSTVEVEVNIFETKKQYITLGKKVSVLVDALPGTAFEGRITAVNPLIDLLSRKFLVKIHIPNSTFVLQAGMFARVEIPEEQKADTLLVPAEAVIERDGRKVLFVAEADTAAERPISTGLVTHEQVEVLEGVAESESVIVEGLYAVKAGTPLIIKN